MISKGGGIFDRSAKAILVTPEMRRLLDIEGESISGEEMIRRILMARVDLLYNGGIGTYVKASTEDNSEVGDRANDRVRINGKDLRAKVVAEGGNLGLTQKGRLEYWACGGRLNTDALDNSAGVDMSDHEVNIKILLDMLVKKGIIKGKEQRNHILAEMTEEVAGLVLADNENQSRALTLDEMRSAARYDEFVNLVEEMVGTGIINRADEDVPGRDELLADPKRERGLPRPLLAKLLGHCKMWAFDLVLGTDIPDSAVAQPFLEAYFPKKLRGEFSNYFQDHTLRREIIATTVVNYLVNNGGISLLSKLMSQTKAGIGEAVAAYLEVDRTSGAQAIRTEIIGAGLEALPEHKLLLEIGDALEASTRDKLQGKAKVEAGKALKEIRQRLKK
jgi:glutamate dehydrogenase